MIEHDTLIKHDTSFVVTYDTILQKDTTFYILQNPTLNKVKPYNWWEPISPIVVLLGFIFGLWQFRRLIKTNTLDVYYKFKNDFYSESCKELSECLICDTLFLEEENNNRPKLYRYQLNELNSQVSKKTVAIDLLDHIDDLYFYYKQGLISIEHIDQGYGALIRITNKNVIIQEFIEKLRAIDHEPDYYIGVKRLSELLENENSDRFFILKFVTRFWLKHLKYRLWLITIK